MVRTQIQLPEKQMKRIKELARTRGISMAELIRQGMEYYLDLQGPVDPTERVERAIQAAGSFGSGQSDVSQEHDRYLEEAYRS
jgi:hypothetical protein